MDRAARPGRHRVELAFLPGLESVVREETQQRLSHIDHIATVSGRDDSLTVVGRCRLTDFLSLRTVVAPFLVLTFDVPRPKSLLSGEHFPALVHAVSEVRRLNAHRPATSLRIEAAGRESTVLRTLAGQLCAATGLHDDPDNGECVVRLRRTPDGPGWDVLVRLSTLPLSARPWRVRGHPAAANATVAAAMAVLTRPRPSDRVVNLMCGSGTLLVERLLAGPAQVAVGVDLDADAVAAARENIASARLDRRARLVVGDIADDEWLRSGPYDVLLADPPWGDKTGRHGRNEEIHQTLLERAYLGAAPGARLAVLTHEVRIMERCLARTRDLWQLTSEQRVFHKGHHPRIYLLSTV
jgi:tRNA (guanine6-N2)-methyltransferase